MSKPYDLRMGGLVGTVAGVPDVDGNTIPVGFDYEAVTVGHYRFGKDAVPALMAAIVSGSLEAAKAYLSSGASDLADGESVATLAAALDALGPVRPAAGGRLGCGGPCCTGEPS